MNRDELKPRIKIAIRDWSTIDAFRNVNMDDVHIDALIDCVLKNVKVVI